MKLSPKEMLKACNMLLGGLYPKIKLYGKEVVDGFERPSFFTELLWRGYRHESKNFASGSAAFVITYFEVTPDELDHLEKVEEIQEAFGMKLCVGDRKIQVTDFEYDYIGENNNILQITVSFEWKENLHEPKQGELMQELDVQIVDRNNQGG